MSSNISLADISGVKTQVTIRSHDKMCGYREGHRTQRDDVISHHEEAESIFSLSLESISSPPNSLLEGIFLICLTFLCHYGVKPNRPLIFSVDNWEIVGVSGGITHRKERTSLVGRVISTTEKGRNVASGVVLLFSRAERSNVRIWWGFLHVASQGHW